MDELFFSIVSSILSLMGMGGSGFIVYQQQAVLPAMILPFVGVTALLMFSLYVLYDALKSKNYKKIKQLESELDKYVHA